MQYVRYQQLFCVFMYVSDIISDKGVMCGVSHMIMSGAVLKV